MLVADGLAFATRSAEQDPALHREPMGTRNTYIRANTRDYQYTAYLEAWRMKIERVGSMNYPQDTAHRALHGSLVLEVALDPDGGVHNISVVRTSGYRLLDDAAVQIVQRAAPFAPFPADIRKETDLLHITRTWQFRAGGLSGVH